MTIHVLAQMDAAWLETGIGKLKQTIPNILPNSLGWNHLRFPFLSVKNEK